VLITASHFFEGEKKKKKKKGIMQRNAVLNYIYLATELLSWKILGSCDRTTKYKQLMWENRM
jgi:hypothetical protein